MLDKLSRIQKVLYLQIFATVIILLLNVFTNLNLLAQTCLNIIPVIFSALYLKELIHHPAYEKEPLRIFSIGLTTISLMLIAEPAEKILKLLDMNLFWPKAILVIIFMALYVFFVRGSFRKKSARS
jgi:hypothetical protein